MTATRIWMFSLAAVTALVVAACAGQTPAAPSTAVETTVVDATAAAAAGVIAAALGDDSAGQNTTAVPIAEGDVVTSLVDGPVVQETPTPAATASPTVAPTVIAMTAASPTASSTASATATATAAPTNTERPTHTPTATLDLQATATAQAQEIAAAVAATLAAQPTATPDWAATRAAEEQQLAAAIAATLTAQPAATFTPRPTATPRPQPTPTAPLAVSRYSIGSSVLGRALEVVEIGSGGRTLLLVGGLHGGFAPSSVSLAQRAADYFSANPQEVPRSLTLSIVLNANPDATYAPGELAGRLNANGVDLNRNWDCDWQPQAKWRDHTVSGGNTPLSEPETQALAAYILNRTIAAVVFWEAKMDNGQVSAGGCGDRTVVSQPFAELYGRSAGYIVEPWTWYPVNGDASNWLDRQGIAAISVLLLDYERMDWENNLRGIRSLLESYD